jgi:rare lipoprotein A (peptidoglycan hydrolase)
MQIIMKKAISFSLFFALFAVFPVIITFAQDLQEGNATWYEDDTLDLSASHARLPPGTRLRVTNLNNQKEVYVTITGRIQNSANRILDLSQAAAELIEMNERGSTPVRLVVIRGLVPEPESPPSNTADNFSYGEYDFNHEDTPVPEITAVSVSPDDENDYDPYNGYSDYNDYSDKTPTQTASAGTPSSPPPPVRTFPQQSAPQAQPRQSAPQTQPKQTAQPPAGHVLLKQLVVIINGKEETIDVPDGVFIPDPARQSSSTPVFPFPPATKRVYIQTLPPPASPFPPPPPPSSPPPVQPPSPVIRVIPNLPDPQSGKVYRIQVGAFSQAALAQVCFERVRTAGLSPAYEINGNLYRVVLSGIRAADVYYTAQRLGAAGFTEAWIREESRY